MSRIKNAFGKNGKAFIAFVTGGDPALAKSEEYIITMIRSGADMIEIGIPFSDPVAEGPVIQEANIRALASGATVEKMFGLAESLRARIAREGLDDVPLVFLSYLNPVFRYRVSGAQGDGYAAFFERCAKSGVDGIIIPDLPFEERDEALPAASSRGVDLISLVAPTSQERIVEIAKASTGFLYIVSSMGVTGVRGNIETDLGGVMARIRGAPPRGAGIPADTLPAAVGFGINTPEQAAAIAAAADGVIVGSAIVKIIAADPYHAGEAIASYVKTMKAAIR
ncbi:MAG: tryptophan synthase subunit alpha [Treponema sp.]|jgi:tryptophan synthase alpha chain|nr:tryptophan synthase subunit alpha [Treponema sp.]